MKKTIELSFILMLFMLSSCGNNRSDTTAGDPLESDSNQLLEKEAWKIHDEVMPKMGTVNKMQARLRERLQKSPDMATEKKQEIQQTIDELENAYEGMMQWMRQFKPENHASSEEATREYLENEMERIKKVKQNILESLEKAEKLSAE